MKILLTGFKPFNNESINPALELIKTIENNYLDHEIYKLELDVCYNSDSIKLIDNIKKINPDVVLSIGQAGGRKKVMLEYFALNMQSASISDNKNVLIASVFAKQKNS